MLVTRPLSFSPTGYLAPAPSHGSAHQLLHAERDALRLRVEADDLHLDLLADGEGFRRMVDAPPGDVGDMQQAVDAAQIDERAVIGDVLDHAVEHLAFLDSAPIRSVRSSARVSSSTARRDTTMLPRRRSILRIWNGWGWPISGPTSRTGRMSTWLPGRKATAPREVDREAALHAAEDHADDAFLIGERLLEDASRLPRGAPSRATGRLRRPCSPCARRRRRPCRLRLTSGGAAAVGEFLEGNAAFGLQADIDDDEIVVDRMTRPLTTVPSKLDEPPSDSSRSAANSALAASFEILRRALPLAIQYLFLHRSRAKRCRPSANRLSPADPLP